MTALLASCPGLTVSMSARTVKQAAMSRRSRRGHSLRAERKDHPMKRTWCSVGMEPSCPCSPAPWEILLRRISWPLGLLYGAAWHVDRLMAGQDSAAPCMAQHLIGKSNILRVSPVVREGRYGLDTLDPPWLFRGLGVIAKGGR